ncbi:MAG TPA: LLM class flavin-dependent oxidoreductase [Trebonia sp.]|jgi:alkanesulfonate monooxygenase SsuD/methylene tetrahydromethanopterin reductase-like flavin-dependent oxidoreductase (luciferase family)|nr:LLM class flavin-dependent oxidoreductase [Trebonia sp.]
MVTASNERLHLAVALDGAGWHPAAWREAGAQPGELLRPGYWVDLARQAERGLLDFLTIEDGLSLQSDDRLRPDQRTDRVRGRLDAVLIAARIGPATRHIGLMPTAVTTHTEPFHLSKAIATLDYVASGRAGVRVQVDRRPGPAAHFGRRDVGEPADAGILAAHFEEAADYVEVLRRLWDSWEDDAEIRDVATGRFIDRDKLHYIDFTGRWFSVKGPSITPRPPQGQPVVAALGHASVPYQLIARSADVGFVTPRDRAQADAIVAEIRAAQRDAGRDEVRLLADIVVFLDDSAAAARARRDRLDERAGTRFTSDALVFTGTAAELADLLLDWQAAGLTGFRLRPATLPHDLAQVTGALVPELQRRGAFRTAYPEAGWAGTLRGLLGLPRPDNRYRRQPAEGQRF